MSIKKNTDNLKYFHFGMKLILVISWVCCNYFLQAQANQADSLYWRRDSVLQERIDTLGLDKVLGEITSGTERAIFFCKKPDAYIVADSAEAWAGWMRWAVILEDQKSLMLIDRLIPVVKSGDHGNWQFYFTYMTLWAAFEGDFKSKSIAERAVVILSQLNTGSPVENLFYEDRMMDLGSAGISPVLDWTRMNILPRMRELDREMLTERDLEFSRLYDRFVLIFAQMLESDADLSVIRHLQSDADAGMQRFAKDILALRE